MPKPAAFRHIKLPYHQDSAELFEKIRTLRGAIFLDSAYPLAQGGRYDILAALPYLKIHSDGQHTHVRRGGLLSTHAGSPFELLNDIHAEESKRLARPELAHLPFAGGFIGYFSYELNHAAILKKAKISTLPCLQLACYDTFIVIDHHLQRCDAYALQEQVEDTLGQLLNCLQAAPETKDDFHLLAAFSNRTSKQKYEGDFAEIQAFLRSGDCYQINYAQRFDSRYRGDPWFAYKRLRQHNPAPFSAYMSTEGGAVLCHSPEQFLWVNNRQIISKPIKGTRPRGADPVADEAQKQALLLSEKDRAENVMIVDLLRNDIGRCAKIGSVHVPILCKLESFATVHHLVSTISAELAERYSIIDLFQACFPGGSITGAPKKRAMEIIDQLESVERTIYCGSIAYLDFNGRMDSNITIRSLLCHQGDIFCWGGGGIVADSTAENEYQESIDKVRILLETLEKTR